MKITLADLNRHGFADHCPRCGLHRTGQHARARFHKHTETCRARIYDALERAGSSKMQFASMDGPERVAVQGHNRGRRRNKKKDRRPSPVTPSEPVPPFVVEDDPEAAELVGP